MSSGAQSSSLSVLGWVANFLSGLLGELDEDASGAVAVSTRRPRARRTTPQYTLVAQEDETGCGIACIAMLAGKKYDEVEKALFASTRKRVFYTSYSELRRGLEDYGLSLQTGRPRRFQSFAQIDGTAIVAVELGSPEKARWHWVVFVSDGRRRYLLDPSWRGTLRTDLRGLKARSFLEVRRSAR